ncbi:MAG: molybdopterin molybdotransferase MoeA [Actinomycetota bacterium]|nr:molybdopterin molybdotransferase MoeA [Actinomycetota bacterium]
MSSGLVPLADAQRRLAALVSPLAPHQVPLAEAVGLVLAEDVAAAEAVPPFACSAMDGYALAATAEPAPLTLKVVRRILAGDVPGDAIGPGEAVRIMTGAPLPPGADAVCMLEDSEAAPDGAVVVLGHSPALGEHVRHAGEDVAAGAVVLERSSTLGPRHLGVLASLGRTAVLAHRRAVVGVLSTGSELVAAPARLAPGQIRDSNRQALLALVAAAGASALDLGLVRDDEDLAVAAVRAGAERCDLLVTSGGVSVGDKDVVKAIIDRCCDHTEVLQVAIKPAKPLAFGRLEGGGVLIGLPGNPVSSVVSFELFVRPTIAALGGGEAPGTVQAIAGEALSRPVDGKLHLLHVRVEVDGDGRLVAWRSGGRASHLLASTVAANALALVADGPGVPSGAVVPVLPLTGARWPASVRPLPGEQAERVGDKVEDGLEGLDGACC